MRKSLLALTASLAAITASTAASAATIIITYEGTVADGTDGAGHFGAVDADLMGLGYVATYTLTYPTLGASEYYTANSHNYEGGTAIGNSTVMSGSLVINGTSLDVAGEYLSRIFKRDEDSSLDQLYTYVDDRVTQGIFTEYSSFHNNLYSYANNITNSLEFDEILTYDFQAGQDQQIGSFHTGIFNNQQRQWVQVTTGRLRPETVSVMLAGGVPEPATWAFMIIGFGAVGGAMRKKNGTTKVAKIGYS